MNNKHIPVLLIEEYGFTCLDGPVMVAIGKDYTDILFNLETFEMAFESANGMTSEPISDRTFAKLNRMIKL